MHHFWTQIFNPKKKIRIFVFRSPRLVLKNTNQLRGNKKRGAFSLLCPGRLWTHLTPAGSSQFRCPAPGTAPRRTGPLEKMRGAQRAATVSSWSGGMPECSAADVPLPHICPPAGSPGLSGRPGVKAAVQRLQRPERREDMKRFHLELESNFCWGGKIITN